MEEATASMPWWLWAAVVCAGAGVLFFLLWTNIYKHVICLKYLFCGWKAVVPIISALPAALGVFLLILVFAVMDGFVMKTREMTRGTLSDIIVDASLRGLPYYDEFIGRVEKLPGVERATPVIQTYAVCRIVSDETDLRVVRPCVLIGIRPADKVDMGRFLEYLQRQGPTHEADNLPPGMVLAPGPVASAKLLAIPAGMQAWREAKGLGARPGAIAGTGLVGRPMTELMRKELPLWIGTRILWWMATGVAAIVALFVWRAGRRRPGRAGWRAAATVCAAVVGLLACGGIVLEGICFGKTEPVAWKKVVDQPLLPYGQDLVAGTLPIRPSGAIDIGPGGIPMAQYQAFTLVDTFKSGYWESDSTNLYVDFDVAQRLAGMAAAPAEGDQEAQPARASQIQVKLNGTVAPDQVVQTIEEAWYGFLVARRAKDFPMPVVNTWETQQRTILGVVEMERNITVLMLGVMLIGFAILTALISYVMAYIKSRDVGILKALGASASGVGSLFLGYGFIIGLLGTAVGLVSALLMVHYIDAIEIYVNQFVGRSIFPRDVYYFDRIPTHLSATWAVAVSLAVLALSTLASMAGGLLAAMKQPVETLRYE